MNVLPIGELPALRHEIGSRPEYSRLQPFRSVKVVGAAVWHWESRTMRMLRENLVTAVIVSSAAGCGLLNLLPGRTIHQKCGWKAGDFFADPKVIALCRAIEANDLDLPPLNVATFRERISGGGNQGRGQEVKKIKKDKDQKGQA